MLKNPSGNIHQPHEKTLKKPTPYGLKDVEKSFSPTRWALKHPSAPRKESEETHPMRPNLSRGWGRADRGFGAQLEGGGGGGLGMPFNQMKFL